MNRCPCSSLLGCTNPPILSASSAGSYAAASLDVMLPERRATRVNSGGDRMTSRDFPPTVALPNGWTKHVRSAVLRAVALAATAWTLARSRAATSRHQRERLRAELDRAQTEIALLKEELSIKDARWSRLLSRRRPHYTPFERMRILQLHPGGARPPRPSAKVPDPVNADRAWSAVARTRSLDPPWGVSFDPRRLPEALEHLNECPRAAWRA